MEKGKGGDNQMRKLRALVLALMLAAVVAVGVALPAADAKADKMGTCFEYPGGVWKCVPES